MTDRPLARGRPGRPPGAARLPGLAMTAALVAGLAVVALGTTVEITSQPDFCGSCHIMKPYYESWKGSTHKNVACVECHIAPGVTAEFRKKYEALSMVTSYFTGTYGTNPWAEIDDAACLRCHERRLLSGKELFGDVLFDHAAHLSGMRRGKTLRCTSCHSQIVQGSHIAVTASTCILCHFKDQPSGTGTARCTLCHHVPDKVIRADGLTFDHGDVERFGMDCTGCHARPEGSGGQVPRERCVTCHNEQSRLQEYGNPDLLHRMHVAEHKVDCTHCHLELEHVSPPRMTASVPACATCHAAGHSPQMSLYAGLGGRGVESIPSPMFLAGIRCEGCHLEIPGHAAEVRKASDVSCMSCHGAGYRGIFLSWKEEVSERTAALRRAVDATGAALGPSKPAAFEDALHNLQLVTRANGIHNVDYARALLARSHQDLNAARSAHGLAALPLPWREAPYDSPCLQCHQGIEARAGRVFDRAFSHAAHVAEAGLQCAACHRDHDEKPRHEVLRFGRAGCDSCHHQDDSKDCLSCHASVRGGVLPNALGDFSHAFHLDEAGQSCADCHELKPGYPVRLIQEHCAACHG
ncbi:MAG TPA: cytochrome c3 family protein [Candidatus Polarisedimenticolia bacterium]|nr:cytochrome c3 family protein [Candidatus Polarisedimenticolia bacterium]